MQIALWKEDFEKEREDREKVQMELDRMRKISLEERQQLHRERDSVCLNLCFNSNTILLKHDNNNATDNNDDIVVMATVILA